MKNVIALCLVLIAASIVQPQNVTVGADPSADLTKYKTYTWDKPLPPGNPIVRQMIIESIEQAMTAKGLTRVDEGGDVTVVYFAATNADIQIGYPSWSQGMGTALA